MASSETVGLVVVAVLVVAAVLSTGIKIIRPYESGIYMSLGRFITVLDCGIHIVRPIFNEVVRIDLRSQKLTSESLTFRTSDGHKIRCDMILWIQVKDAKKAFFEVTNYRKSALEHASAAAEEVMAGTELKDVASSIGQIESKIEDMVSRESRSYAVDIRKVGFEVRGIGPILCSDCGFANPSESWYCGRCRASIRYDKTATPDTRDTVCSDDDPDSAMHVSLPEVAGCGDSPYETDRWIRLRRKKKGV